MADNKTYQLTPAQVMSYNQGLESSAKLLDNASTMALTSGMAKVAKTSIDYSLLNTKAMFEETQANYVELKTSEEINMLMQKFNSAVGTAQYGAARRNVKLGEGSIAQDIEQSAMNLGEDIQLAKKNAKAKANALRTQSKINKRSALISLGTNAISAYSGISRAGSLSDNAAETRANKLIV